MKVWLGDFSRGLDEEFDDFVVLCVVGRCGVYIR